MTVRQQLASLDLRSARAALEAAVQARTFTAADRTTIEAAVQQRVAERMAANQRFNSADLLRECAGVVNRMKLETAAYAAKTVSAQIVQLRDGLQAIQRAARGPAPLPTTLMTDEERRRRLIPFDEAYQIEELRVIHRTLRRLEFQGEYGTLSTREQVTALERAEQAKDLELVHWLEPRIERALAVEPAARTDGDLDAYMAAKQEHTALVTRLEGIRDGRLTKDDQAALADVQSQLHTIDHDWNRPGGEADQQRARLHTGVIVPADLVVPKPEPEPKLEPVA